MRILIFMMFLFCMVCCRKNELQFPDCPAVSGLMEPVFLHSDTTWIDWGEYFLYPEKIKKITPAPQLKAYWTKDRRKLGLTAVDSGVLLSNVRVRYEKSDYDIPVICPDPDTRFLIRTSEVNGDTIFLQSSAPVVDWAVYLQNYRLDGKFLWRKEERLGIVLPEIASKVEYGKLRIWARDSAGISNDVVIPLRKGKVITEVGLLDSTSKESALLYALEIDVPGTSGKRTISDSGAMIFHHSEIAGVWQKVENGYFHELGIHTLCISTVKSNDSLSADIEMLAEAARGHRINVAWDSLMQDTPGQREKPYWKKLDWPLFDRAVAVFARSKAGFRSLHRLLENDFQHMEENNTRIHFSGSRKKSRFITSTDEYMALAFEPGEQQDTVYRKLVQLLVFNATVPGIPMIYCGDELGWPKRNCPPMDREEWNGEQLAVKSKVVVLNKLRSENMALLYGDFIPLRVEDRIYAYLRTYFGKNVLVVFNKGNETVSLKLDLPPMKRDEQFHALFGNRFSYDNSKVILDVPANGVEIIYN